MDVGQGVRRGTRYRDRPGGLALLFLSSVGDPACRHEADGEGDGEDDQGSGVALHGVGEGGGVSLLLASRTAPAWRLAESKRPPPTRVTAPLMRSFILVPTCLLTTLGSTCW